MHNKAIMLERLDSKDKESVTMIEGEEEVAQTAKKPSGTLLMMEG